MTPSISSVSAGSSAASEAITKKSTLSSDTKAKLEALGITVTDGMTEAEAQNKIAAAEAEQNAQNQKNASPKQRSCHPNAARFGKKTLNNIFDISIKIN